MPRLASLAVAAGLLAGCGAARATRPASSARAHVLGRGQAERALGNAFRRGLYRLAVMTQPGEDPTDLGQPLPTGLLDTVACAGAPPRRCTVRWQAVDGRARRTGYRIRLTKKGCLYANAEPALPQIQDVLTKAPAEDPRNFLVAAVRGC